jgi:drug/metabolite transporter (DMT)-like permease
MPQVHLTPLWLLIFTPLSWAAAILIMRDKGVPSYTIPYFIVVGSLIACAIVPLVYFPEFSRPTLRQSGIALVAGIFNGVGLFLFWGGLVGGASRGLWDLSTVVPITYTLLLSIVAFGSWLVFDERFTLDKWLGVAFGVASIALLSWRSGAPR